MPVAPSNILSPKGVAMISFGFILAYVLFAYCLGLWIGGHQC